MLLLQAVNSSLPEVRKMALQMLGEQSIETVGQNLSDEKRIASRELLLGIKQGSDFERSKAILDLILRGQEKDIAFLIIYLTKGNNPDISMKIKKAFESLEKTPKVESALLRLAEDPLLNIRRTALELLDSVYHTSYRDFIKKKPDSESMTIGPEYETERGSVVSEEEFGMFDYQLIDASANTTNAMRKKLRTIICQANKSKNEQTLLAVRELIEIGNAEDIMFLLRTISACGNVELAEKIKQQIIDYTNNDYLIKTLGNASAEVSLASQIVAASILFEKKEMQAVLFKVAELIRDGYSNKCLIEIIERVPDHSSYSAMRYRLNEISHFNESFKCGRVFAILVNAAYFGRYMGSYKEIIFTTLNDANMKYFGNALKVLHDILVVGGENAEIAMDILRKLQQSKIEMNARDAKELLDVEANNGKGTSSISQTKTSVFESDSNTFNARSQRLRKSLSNATEGNIVKARMVVLDLIDLGKSEDLVFLITTMAEKPESLLAKVIRNELMAYAEWDLLINSTKNEVLANSLNTGLLAVDILIDKGALEEAPSVLASMVKKGIISSRIIDAFKRIKDRNSHMRYPGELNKLAHDETYPLEIRIFAILLDSAFGNGESFSSEGWKTAMKISTITNHEFLLNALRLIEIAITTRDEKIGTNVEMLRELAKSTDEEIVRAAKNILEKHNLPFVVEKEQSKDSRPGLFYVFATDEKTGYAGIKESEEMKIKAMKLAGLSEKELQEKWKDDDYLIRILAYLSTIQSPILEKKCRVYYPGDQGWEPIVEKLLVDIEHCSEHGGEFIGLAIGPIMFVLSKLSDIAIPMIEKELADKNASSMYKNYLIETLELFKEKAPNKKNRIQKIIKKYAKS